MGSYLSGGVLVGISAALSSDTTGKESRDAGVRPSSLCRNLTHAM